MSGDERRRPERLRTPTRRAVLGTIGCLPLAGCSVLPFGSSSIDGDRLAAIVDDTDVPSVDHEFPLPVTVDHIETRRRRVETLLRPIPPSIDPETVPNETIRDRIERRRERAFEDLSTALDEPTRRDLLERLRTAHRYGAEAAGVWAAIDDGRTRDDVSDSVADLREELAAFDEQWEYHVGDDPLEAVYTYADVEQLVDDADEELNAVGTVDEPVRSLAVGEMAAHREAGRASLEDARRLYDEFVDSLEEAETPVIHDAGRSLEELLAERRRSLPVPFEQEPHEFVDRDTDPDSTTATVLGELLRGVRGEATRGEPSVDREPARYVLFAHTALVALGGFERVRSRIDEGESIEIDDADDVDAYRTEAIVGVESLLEADSRSLERQIAFDLAARIERPDQSLTAAAGETIEPETMTYPVAQYCWIAGMADATPAVVDTIHEAL